MGARLAALALLLTGAGRLFAQESGIAFSPTLPERIGDVSGWEIVSGDFETAQIRGGYRLYVNPARPALYQLMRYRIDRLPAAPPEVDPRLGVERVAFIRHPGVREPMLYWRKQPRGVVPAWHEVPHGTREYQDEMGLLMRVLAVHRGAREAQP
jgi:hypothetical protein